MRSVLAVARIEIVQSLRSPVRLLMLAAVTLFAGFVTSPANFMPGDFAGARDWWLAGQTFWVAGEYMAIVAFCLFVGSVQNDRVNHVAEQQMASPLRGHEYAFGKLAGDGLVALLPGMVLLVAVPVERLVLVGHAQLVPYILAFAGLYLPPVLLAVAAAVALGVVFGSTRAAIVTYGVLWAISMFPFVIAGPVAYVTPTSTPAYGAFFEFGDPGAMDRVPVELRTRVARDLASIAAAAKVDLVVQVALTAVMVALLLVWLRGRWSGDRMELLS
jgi:hypothetical protein